MMPGVGFAEMVLLAVVALVVVGPRDLPLMMRKFGRFTGKMRAMAFEFRQGFEELGRQAELEELRREVADLKKHTGLSEIEQDLRQDAVNLESDVTSALHTGTRSDEANRIGGAAPSAMPLGTAQTSSLEEELLAAQAAQEAAEAAVTPAEPPPVAPAQPTAVKQDVPA